MAGTPRGRLRPHRKRSKTPLILGTLAAAGLLSWATWPDETPSLALSANASAPQIEAAFPEPPPAPETPEPVVPEAPEFTRIENVLEKNQTMGAALAKLGIDAGESHRLIEAASAKIDFRKSRPGDIWTVELDKDNSIREFEYQASPENRWIVRRTEDGFVAEDVQVDREIKIETVRGKIDSSLWLAFDSQGASGALAQRFTELFQYTIDFNSETQPGDEFSVIYEKVFVDGEYLRDGKVLGAKYSGQVGTYYGFFHDDPENPGYFDENGDNLKRQFLKSPLATVRITSNFGRRFHPVLKKMKLHAGVDFGAPTGTPVHAVADGTVIYAGWKGANGKLVSLRHANGFVTHYAHLSQITKKLRPGVRVKQKDQIGRVGTTGRSTGPHLHFGMTQHGKVINPLTVDFARAEPLKGAERQAFKEKAESLKAQL